MTESDEENDEVVGTYVDDYGDLVAIMKSGSVKKLTHRWGGGVPGQPQPNTVKLRPIE